MVAFVAGDAVDDGTDDSTLLSDVSPAVSESSWLDALGLGTENLGGSNSSSPLLSWAM